MTANPEPPTRALWITKAASTEIRETDILDGPDHIQVSTLFSGISRGTERLVFHGQVPRSEHDTMRAPFQQGDFTFPVKYGYSAVGTVQSGPREGETVFALYPHQTRFSIPSHAAISINPSVPPARAVLAANMETALNIMWDAGVCAGSKVTIVGGGVVGALTGYLCARTPGTEVCIVDIDPDKAALAGQLGCAFATPENVPEDADMVIHTSATSSGLATAINAAGVEATIIEASWYGDHLTTVPLGAQFHQRRLRIISSQVGRIPAHMGARWDYKKRLTKAVDLLADPVLDVLISGETDFADLPENYGSILEDPSTLCHRIRYSNR
ncbi:zinc-dependent alcohol dehydrogenase [Ruegeria lacuscaerulensis]|uniref:zinc-dependent alcohol dehydrogenase n=1 Tax=Ruegeria lacuscaerulensis TaxID=55218 RepID=UPI00148034B9|nr:zinc-binding alcohol dehydrogenase [Ruegeria lacuscaerulensis]